MERTDNLAVWLFERRRAARLTQDELAAKSGVSKSYISMLERGGAHPLTGKPTRPSAEKLEDLARALGVPADEALFAAGYAPRDPSYYPVGIPAGSASEAVFVSGMVETRELHDDAREEYDRIYFAFEGEPGFSRLSPSEKDALVRRALEASRRPERFQPGDFRRAVEEAERKRREGDGG